MIKYKYKFPEHENNYDLFSMQNDYNVFINASGFTYLGSYTEFSKGFPYHNSIAMKIPMGYKSLLVYERLNIIENGVIIWSNSDENSYIRKTFDGKELEYFDNTSFPVISKKLINVYCIFNELGEYGFGAYCGFIDDYETALTKAIELSKTQNLKFLVCKVLAWEQWH